MATTFSGRPFSILPIAKGVVSVERVLAPVTVLLFIAALGAGPAERTLLLPIGAFSAVGGCERPLAAAAAADWAAVGLPL